MSFDYADKRPYWATRQTWPRGRSCSDNSPVRTYWFRSVLWSADDRAKLAEEIEQELEYRRRHEALMNRYANLDLYLSAAAVRLKFMDSVV